MGGGGLIRERVLITKSDRQRGRLLERGLKRKGGGGGFIELLRYKRVGTSRVEVQKRDGKTVPFRYQKGH